MSQVMANPSQYTNQIPYWGYYGGMQGGGAYMDQDPNQTQMGQQFLAAARKYDPNAQFTSTTDPNSGQTHWYTQFDSSKIPNFNKAIDLNQGDFNPQYYSALDHGDTEAAFMKNQSHSFDTSQLYNPNYRGVDPILGQVTNRANLKPQGTSWLDIAGPLAVGGFGALAGGALSGLNSLFLKAPQTIGNWASGNGSFNPFQLAGAGLSFIPGMNPFMAQLGRFGLNQLGRG